jgi:hypothetical protein
MPVGGTTHVPSAPAPPSAATLQIPVQQSTLRAHTSPGWVQKDDASEHVEDFGSQYPEQQSAFALQALPAVWQPVLSAVHVIAPPAPPQVPPQHCAPVVHDWPSDVHCVAPQTPPWHTSEQQSGATWQGAPPTAQWPTFDAQVCAFGSQRPEQQSAPVAQMASNALQLTLPPPSPPGLADPSPAEASWLLATFASDPPHEKRTDPAKNGVTSRVNQAWRNMGDLLAVRRKDYA